MVFCHTLTWISHGVTYIPHPDPTSLSTRSFWVFPVHQARALVSCIQPGLVICFTLDNIHVSMLFSWNIPPSPSSAESFLILEGNKSFYQNMLSKWKKVSRLVMSNSLWPHGLNNPWNSPGQDTGVGSLSLLQGIFPSQGSNPGLPHPRRILYQLSHQGSLGILEWVAYPFSSGIFPSWESNQGLLYYRQILYQLS